MLILTILNANINVKMTKEHEVHYSNTNNDFNFKNI
jgi:hypothetical protein